MRVTRRWLWCVAASAVAHGVAFIGLSRAARVAPPHDRSPITMSIQILSPALPSRPMPRRESPSAASPRARGAFSALPASRASPPLAVIGPEDLEPAELPAMPAMPAVVVNGDGVLGLSVGGAETGGSAVSSGSALRGGGTGEGTLPGGEASAACWADIDRDLQARARSRVPRALQRRGLVGRATVLLTLDDQGRAQQIRFEDLEGSPLIPEAVRAILAEPFRHTCAGETRWRVSFELRRT
jgi:hypothetical protein